MRRTALPVIEPLEARIAPAGGVFDLSQLNGSNGFKVTGGTQSVVSGYSVSDAGDINGDGFGDVAVSDPYAEANGDSSGGAYVIFGRAAGLPSDINLDSLNGTNGFRMNGIVAYDRIGRSVSSAGDVNGDGFDDLIIGAPFADPTTFGSRGTAYVVFGRASGFQATLDLGALSGANGFRLQGVGDTDLTGISVSGAGDVNGDGFDDVIVGAPRAASNGYASGATFVVFGRTSGFAPVVPLSGLDGSNGFRVSGAVAGDYSGYSVSGAGDTNGDGFDDVIIGAKDVDTNGNSSGATYVIFGRANGFAANLQVSLLDGFNGYRILGVAADDRSGYAVHGAGDVNGDGFDDVVIGAPSSDSNGLNSGSTYVVYGRNGVIPAVLSLSTLNGSNGFRIIGLAADDRLGSAVSTAGNLNGDGFADLIIGAPYADSNGANAGSAYIIFGRSSFGANFVLSNLDGNNGFRVNGLNADDRLGTSVSFAGDFNRDGFSDVVAGADRFGVIGQSYVIAGRASQTPPSIKIDDIAFREGSVGEILQSFVLTLSTPSLDTISIDYSVGDGTADPISDYTGVPFSTLVFLPGELTKRIAVAVLGDINVESNETFFVNLSNPLNVTLVDAQAIGTILNDDAALAISPDGSSMAFIDPAGNEVQVEVNRGELKPENFIFTPEGALLVIDLLADQQFSGARINVVGITVDGDRMPVDLEFLDATGIDLGQVKISGELGRVLAGDGDPTKPAIKSLKVAALGTADAVVEPLISELRGDFRKLVVKGDVRGAAVDATGRIGKVQIAGDLLGQGGTGSVILAAIEDGRSLRPRVSGGIPVGAFDAAAIGLFRVEGRVDGGSVTSESDIGEVEIGGDLSDAAIAAAGRIKVVRVFGALQGADASNPSVIAALARVGSTKPSGAAAIDNLNVRGDVANAQILLGYATDRSDAGVSYVARNSDASSGKVTIKGNWTASSLVAGIFDGTGDGFGQNDQSIPGDTTQDIVSRIATVVIRGTASGSVAAGDHYAITAEEIRKLSIAGQKVVLSKELKDNVLLDLANNDFRLVEI